MLRALRKRSSVNPSTSPQCPGKLVNYLAARSFVVLTIHCLNSALIHCSQKVLEPAAFDINARADLTSMARNICSSRRVPDPEPQDKDVESRPCQAPNSNVTPRPNKSQPVVSLGVANVRAKTDERRSSEDTDARAALLPTIIWLQAPLRKHWLGDIRVTTRQRHARRHGPEEVRGRRQARISGDARLQRSIAFFRTAELRNQYQTIRNY